MEILDSTPSPTNPTGKPWGMEVNNYLMLMHLSQFSGFIVPFAGLVMPLIMWLTNNEKFSEVDRHGKMIINWLISALIYGMIAGLFTLVFIGIPLLIVLGLLMMIFPIIGAIKAAKGELWPYPLTLSFIK